MLSRRLVRLPLLAVSLGLAFAYGIMVQRNEWPPFSTLVAAKAWLLSWRPPAEGRFFPARQASNSDGYEATAQKLRNLGYLSGVNPSPELDGVTIWKRDLAYQGLNLAIDGHDSEAILVDMSGRVLHRWSYAFEDASSERGRSLPPAVKLWRNVALSPDGDLFAIFESRLVIKLDQHSRLLWKYPNAHHDLQLMEDGRLYVLTQRVELLPRLHPSKPVRLDFVTVLSPDGELEFEVSILEAIERSDYRHLLRFATKSGDLLHTNSLEVLDGRLASKLPAFEKGNVLISMAAINTLAVLDMEQRKIVWAATGLTAFQHDPGVLDSERLLLFDNSPGPEEASRVLELDPVTQEVHWSYDGREFDLYSATCGAVQRLPNGNTLITESENGRAFEVTRDKETVWEYLTPHRAGENDELIAALFRVIRLDEASVSQWLTLPAG